MPTFLAPKTATSIARSIASGAAALTFLPALTTSGASYHSVAGVERLLSGYSGPLASLVGSGGTTNVGTGSTGITASAVQTARGTNPEARVATWHDQSGGGRDWTQATTANQFAMREDGLINSRPAMLVDSRHNISIRGMNATHSLDRANFTIFDVIDPCSSAAMQVYYEYFTGGSLDFLLYQDNTGASGTQTTLSFSAGGADATGKYLASVPQVVVTRSSSTARTTIIDGVATTQSPMSSSALTTTTIGSSLRSGFSGYAGFLRYLARVVVYGALSDADVAAVSTALTTRFGIVTTFDAVVVNQGTSRVSGSLNSTETFNRAWYERPRYTKRIKTYNLGIDAQPISTSYANRTQYEGAIFSQNSALGLPYVFVIDDAINDVGGLGTSTDPTTIYNSTITPYVSYVKGLGANCKAVVCTTAPQDSASYPISGRTSAAVNTDRVSLNTKVVANVAGANAIADIASEPNTGAYPGGPDNSTLCGADLLHWTSAGYALQSTYLPAAVNALV